MAKIFISHKFQDTDLAKSIYNRLIYTHGLEAFLDVIDTPLSLKGEDLAAHIQTELGKCTQLLAVVSPATQESWWVPWEIGVASEKDYPLATYVSGTAEIPDYLKKWPYLRTQSDLDIYASASRNADQAFRLQKSMTNDTAARIRSTSAFFSQMRRELRR